LKYTYERELVRSAGKDSPGNTLIHPCLQNLACPNLLRRDGPQGQCLTKHDIARKVLTDEELEDIRALLEIRPQKSVRRLSQETGVSVSSASKATKLIKLRPYRAVIKLDNITIPAITGGGGGSEPVMPLYEVYRRVPGLLLL
jgi:hypothetical protein